MLLQREVRKVLLEVSGGRFDAHRLLRDALSDLVLGRDAFVRLIEEGCKLIKKGPPYLEA